MENFIKTASKLIGVITVYLLFLAITSFLILNEIGPTLNWSDTTTGVVNIFYLGTINLALLVLVIDSFL